MHSSKSLHPPTGTNHLRSTEQHEDTIHLKHFVGEILESSRRLGSFNNLTSAAATANQRQEETAVQSQKQQQHQHSSSLESHSNTTMYKRAPLLLNADYVSWADTDRYVETALHQHLLADYPELLLIEQKQDLLQCHYINHKLTMKKMTAAFSVRDRVSLYRQWEYPGSEVREVLQINGEQQLEGNTTSPLGLLDFDGNSPPLVDTPALGGSPSPGGGQPSSPTATSTTVAPKKVVALPDLHLQGPKYQTMKQQSKSSRKNAGGGGGGHKQKRVANRVLISHRNPMLHETSFLDALVSLWRVEVSKAMQQQQLEELAAQKKKKQTDDGAGNSIIMTISVPDAEDSSTQDQDQVVDPDILHEEAMINCRREERAVWERNHRKVEAFISGNAGYEVVEDPRTKPQGSRNDGGGGMVTSPPLISPRNGAAGGSSATLSPRSGGAGGVVALVPTLRSNRNALGDEDYALPRKEWKEMPAMTASSASAFEPTVWRNEATEKYTSVGGHMVTVDSMGKRVIVPDFVTNNAPPTAKAVSGTDPATGQKNPAHRKQVSQGEVELLRKQEEEAIASDVILPKGPDVLQLLGGKTRVGRKHSQQQDVGKGHASNNNDNNANPLSGSIMSKLRGTSNNSNAHPVPTSPTATGRGTAGAAPLPAAGVPGLKEATIGVLHAREHRGDLIIDPNHSLVVQESQVLEAMMKPNKYLSSSCQGNSEGGTNVRGSMEKAAIARQNKASQRQHMQDIVGGRNISSSSSFEAEALSLSWLQYIHSADVLEQRYANKCLRCCADKNGIPVPRLFLCEMNGCIMLDPVKVLLDHPEEVHTQAALKQLQHFKQESSTNVTCLDGKIKRQVPLSEAIAEAVAYNLSPVLPRGNGAEMFVPPVQAKSVLSSSHGIGSSPAGGGIGEGSTTSNSTQGGGGVTYRLSRSEKKSLQEYMTADRHSFEAMRKSKQSREQCAPLLSQDKWELLVVSAGHVVPSPDSELKRSITMWRNSIVAILTAQSGRKKEVVDLVSHVLMESIVDPVLARISISNDGGVQGGVMSQVKTMTPTSNNKKPILLNQSSLSVSSTVSHSLGEEHQNISSSSSSKLAKMELTLEEFQTKMRKEQEDAETTLGEYNEILMSVEEVHHMYSQVSNVNGSGGPGGDGDGDGVSPSSSLEDPSAEGTAMMVMPQHHMAGPPLPNSSSSSLHPVSLQEKYGRFKLAESLFEELKQHLALAHKLAASLYKYNRLVVEYSNAVAQFQRRVETVYLATHQCCFTVLGQALGGGGSGEASETNGASSRSTSSSSSSSVVLSKLLTKVSTFLQLPSDSCLKVNNEGRIIIINTTTTDGKNGSTAALGQLLRDRYNHVSTVLQQHNMELTPLAGIHSPNTCPQVSLFDVNVQRYWDLANRYQKHGGIVTIPFPSPPSELLFHPRVMRLNVQPPPPRHQKPEATTQKDAKGGALVPYRPNSGVPSLPSLWQRKPANHQNQHQGGAHTARNTIPTASTTAHNNDDVEERHHEHHYGGGGAGAAPKSGRTLVNRIPWWRYRPPQSFYATQ